MTEGRPRLTALWRRVEAALSESRPSGGPEDSPAELRELLREVCTHQDELARENEELRLIWGGLELENEELKRAQADVATSRDRYRAGYERSATACLSLARDGRILEVNDAAARLLGEPRGRVAGRRLVAYLAVEDQPALVRHLRAVFAQDAPRAVRLRLADEAGTHLHVESQATTAPASIADTCSTVLVDVTDRVRIEESLGQREADLRTILDTVVDAVVTVDGKGRIESFNRAAERMFGYSAAEVLGRDVELLAPPAWRPKHRAEFGRSLCAGQGGAVGGRRIEVEGQRKDGAVFPAELAVAEQEGGGSERRFTGVVTDISARKRLEEELRRTQRLEAVGRLAFGIAHEYKNLLMGIQGVTGIALERLEDRTGPAAAALGEVRDAADRGVSLAVDLLAFSRAEEEPAPRATVVLDRTLDGVERLLAPLIGEDVTVRVEAGAPGAVVPGDESALQQIVLNLALNARDAMPHGGRLEVATARVDVDAEEASSLGVSSGPYATLSVRDTGQGMDPRGRARAFEPFFTTKGPGEGTGLGLSTVYGLARARGGSARVESAVDAGTTVTVLLPFAEEEDAGSGRAQEPGDAAEADADRAAADRSADAPGAVEDRTVLVVEDDPLVRRTLCYYLSGEDLRVREAADADAARRAWEAEPIDVLLADICVPGATGPELREELRQRHPAAETVYVSAYPREDLEARAHLGPEDRFVAKPCGAPDLLEAVRDALAARERTGA